MMYDLRNEKGFTLAELLGVITILAIISLITVPLVNKYISNSRQKAYDVEITTLKKAAQQWFTRNSTSVVFDQDNFYALDLEALKQSEYLSDQPIFNPLNPDEEITGCIMIRKNESNYSYEYSATCTGTFNVYANGTAVYFNPATGTKCTSDAAVSTTGTKTGCMKWYTFNDSLEKDTINLILDHNTTALVAWNSTGNNVNGPTNALSQLATDTSSWSGVPTRSDSYSVSNGTATYTINYNTYKARLITAAEIATITGNTSFKELNSGALTWFYFDSNNQTQTATSTGASNYDWLFDYTNYCTDYGCSIADSSTSGYWTATSVAFFTNKTWIVRRNGYLHNLEVDNTINYGIRPVITISKSSL